MNNDDYMGWKNWQEKDFGRVTPGARFYFRQVLDPKMAKCGKVLEIGFGNGSLMGYLREKGHSVIGLEVNEELVRRAVKNGYLAYKGAAWEIAAIQKIQFDFIIVFDVLEHMRQGEIVSLFKWVKLHLSENGSFILKFPEGASPFGRAGQHGDFSHVTVLTRSKVQILCVESGLILKSYDDDLLSSNTMSSWGLIGRVALRIIQSYAALVKKILRILLYPLAPSMSFATNSIAVIVGQQANPSS